jgi:hypothetical protein
VQVKTTTFVLVAAVQRVRSLTFSTKWSTFKPRGPHVVEHWGRRRNAAVICRRARR